MPSAVREFAGALNQLVTLEAPSETAPSGDASIPYTVQASVWAQMAGLSGMNRNGLVAEAGYRFVTRYRSDVTPRWRIALGTRTFQIISAVDPDGRRRELSIFAQEILA